MKIAIIGGGTFNHIRNHLSLAAPAFGSVAKQINDIIQKNTFRKLNDPIDLYLTQMAGGDKSLSTNKDVSNLLDKLALDGTNIIFMSAAICDYDVTVNNDPNDPDMNIFNGPHSPRLKTSDGHVLLELEPAEKIIARVRKVNPEIFLVGFKTTTLASIEEQFIAGLKMMKSTKCNLVLANDVITRQNIIITPEETYYTYENRYDAIKDLVDITLSRAGATYTRTNFIESPNYNFNDLHINMQSMLKYLINRGSFICNNGNGFTPGHFCEKLNDNTFVSSQRKANHNLVEQNGLTKIVVDGENDNAIFNAYGDKKASVGARSQWMILKENPDYDFIIHTHSPLKEGSNINIRPQKFLQCGSTECGINTLDGLTEYTLKSGNKIKAVMLDKHGPNILFSKLTPVNELIEFMEDNFYLNIKTT